MMNDRKFRRGASLVYVTVMMVAMLAICSLAVDVARVQVAKTELRRAVDGAARFGAIGLDRDAATAFNNAAVSASDNQVDGRAFALVTSEDVILGTWDSSARKFTAVSVADYAKADSVQVIGRKIASRNTAIPMTFATVIGVRTCDIKTVSAIAKVTRSINVDQNVPATANPFLSGMPYGAVASLNNPHNSPDYAGNTSTPRQSPLQVAMPISGGLPLTFDGISGDARHDPNLAYFAPDGELGDIGGNSNGSENGISNLKAPINALVGVFLTDEAPNKTPTPTFTAEDLAKAPTDFSSAANRNLQSYQPKLKQLFFIGDGKTDAGLAQTFVAPQGATRLYLATWDFYEWNNNAGQRNVKVARPASVTLVK